MTRGRPSGKEARRPLFITRYPGGKCYLHRWIECHLPKTRRYVEGFAGVATVLLNRPRAKEEFLVEKSLDQATLLRTIRDHNEGLAWMLRPLRWSRTTFLDAKFLLEGRCYSDDLTRAKLAYTFRKMSRGGEGNSFSFDLDRNQQHWWDNGVEQLTAVSRRLRGVHVLHGDALDRLAGLDGPETLFYLDPPYVRSSRSLTSLYGEYEMTDGEHRELCRLIRRLAGKVVLSGYLNPIYEELLPDWRRESREMYVFAHYNSSNPRRRKTEVIWMNF